MPAPPVLPVLAHLLGLLGLLVPPAALPASDPSTNPSPSHSSAARPASRALRANGARDGDGGGDGEGMVSSHAVSSGAVSSGAVSSGAVSSGAVSSGAVSSGAVSSGAVSSGTVSSGTVSSGTVSSGTVSAPAAPHGVWPLQPRPLVVQGFDPPSNPYGAGHRGVDLLGAVGEPVRTALPGTVTYAGPLAGRGVVVVDHGTTRTTYEPVDASVAVGTQVGAGAVLGTLTASGSRCPPAACLHWGWIRNDGSTGPPDYLDPLELVEEMPMRLLPLD